MFSVMDSAGREGRWEGLPQVSSLFWTAGKWGVLSRGGVCYYQHHLSKENTHRHDAPHILTGL